MAEAAVAAASTAASVAARTIVSERKAEGARLPSPGLIFPDTEDEEGTSPVESA